MSKWWTLRLIWLALGLLTGVMGLLPDAAEVLIGVLALIYGVAWAVLLGRWLAVEFGDVIRKKTDADTVAISAPIFPGTALEVEATKPRAARPRPGSSWFSRWFRAPDYRLKARLTTEEKPDAAKTALVWDSLLFLGAVVLSAAAASLWN
jgi:hypothetical protein